MKRKFERSVQAPAAETAAGDPPPLDGSVPLEEQPSARQELQL
jgi:hypothetical protein